MNKQDRLLTFFPEEIQFELNNVKNQGVITEYLKVINMSKTIVDIQIKATSSDRYDISPSTLKIGPNENKSIGVSLQISKLSGKKGEIIDHLIIKGNSSEYKVPVIIFNQEDSQEDSVSPRFKIPQKIISNKPPLKPPSEMDELKGELEITRKDNYLLVEKIKEYEEIIASLNERIEQDRKIDISKFLDEIDEKDQIINGLEKELKEKEKTIENLHVQLDQKYIAEDYLGQIKELLRQKSPDLESVVDIALKQEKLKDEKKNQQILEKFQIRDQTITNLEKRLKEIEADNQKLQEMVEDQRTMLQNNEELVKNLQKENQQYKDLSQKHQQKAQELTEELATLKYTLGSYHTEMSFRDEDKSKLEQQIVKLSDELSTYKNEISKYEKLTYEMRNKIDVYEKNLEDFAEREEYIKELYQRQLDAKTDSSRMLTEKDKLIQDLHNKLFEANKALDTMYKQMGLEDSQRKDLIDKLRSDADQRIKQILDENERLRNVIHEMNANMNQSSSYSQSNPMRTDDLRDSYDQSRDNNNKEKKKISNLENQINDLTSSVSQLQKNLLDEKRLNTELITTHNNKINELVNHIDEIKRNRKVDRRDMASQTLPNNPNEKITEHDDKKPKDEDTRVITKKYEELAKRCKEAELEKHNLMEEVEILSKRLEIKEKDELPEAGETNLVSKLNARISSLKHKEQRLLEDNAKLENLYNELRAEFEEAKSHWQSERSDFMQVMNGGGSKDDQQMLSEKKSFTRGESPSRFGYHHDKGGIISVGAGASGGLGDSEFTGSFNADMIKKENQMLRSIKSNLENEIMLSLNKEKFLQNNLDMITNERNEFKEKVNQLKREIQDIEQDKKELEKLFRDETTNLKKQLIECQNELKHYKDSYYNIEREIQSKDILNEKLTVTERMKNQIEEELIQVRSNYGYHFTELNDQVKTLKKLNEEFKHKINELEMELSIQSKEVMDREATIIDLRKENNDLFNKLKKLEIGNNDLEKVNSDISIQLKSLREEFNKVKDMAERENKRRDGVEKELQDRIHVLQDQLNYSNTYRSKDKEGYSQEIDKLSKMHQESLNLLKEDNRELEQKLFAEIAEKNHEIENWTKKEQILLAQINELKNHISHMENGIDSKTKSEIGSAKKDRKRLKAPKGLNSTIKSYNSDGSDSEMNPYLKKERNKEKERLLELDLNAKNLEIIELRRDLDNFRYKVHDLQNQNAKIIKEKNVLLQENERITMLLDNQKKEIEKFDIEKKLFEKNDSKISQELSELRTYISTLKQERDRITKEMKSTEDLIQNDQKQTENLLKFIRDLENKSRRTETEASEKINELENKLIILNKDINRYTQENTDLRNQLVVKASQLDHMDHQNNETKRKLDQEIEMREEFSQKISELEYMIKKDGEKYTNIMRESKEEIEKLTITIECLKEEMIEQNKRHEETIDIYEKQLIIAREKFQGDFKDLQTKFNMYFNQSEPYKRSLSPKKEKKTLDKLIENYIENLQVYGSKEAIVQNLQDKLKSLTAENKILKGDLKKFQEQLQKLRDENQALMNKKSSMLITKYKKTSKNDKLDSIQQANNPNKENFDFDTKDKDLYGLQKSSIKDTAILEAQLITSKSENRKQLEEIRQLTQINLGLQNDIETLLKSEEILQAEIKKLNKDIVDMQKIHKNEINKLLNDVDSIKSKWHSPDEFQKIHNDIQEADQALKQAKDEIQRKNNLINQLKQQIENKGYDESALKKENEALKEEVEKVKRNVKEGQRKEANFREYKEKLDSMKQTEKTLIEEKNQAMEKIKSMKTEITRREATIKDLKDKLDVLTLQNESKKMNEEETDKQKETIRKLKLEIDRKDQNLKALKSKLDTVLLELDHLKTENLSRAQTSSMELDREMKRHEQTKLQLKRLDTQFSNLIFILRRLYRDTYSIVQKFKTRLQKTYGTTITANNKQGHNVNINKYSDSLDILNLSPEEIQMFVDAPMNQRTLPIDMNAQQKAIERFEDELSNSENLNPSLLYEMINSIIEERIALEKKQQDK